MLVPVFVAVALCGCGGPEKRPPSGVRITPGPTRAPRPLAPPPAYSVPRVVTPPPAPRVTQPPPPLPYAPPPVVPKPPPPSVAAAPAARPQWLPLHALAAQFGLSAPVRVTQTAFQLRSAAGAFQFTVGTRVATWNGYRFYLGFAPAVTNGVPFIHSLDVDKNLAPLLQVNRPVARGRGVIVLDPGHGGPDNGTKSALGKEKDYTLDWARRLKPLLEARGWKVVLTRTTDRGVELPERVLIAEQHQADIFLSLHLNAAATPGAAGLETFCLTPAGLASTLTRNYADPANLALPGNARDFENMRLAMRVHRSLLQTAGMPDRGVQRARFMAVLKTQQRPAVLIEAGYLSDRNEARLIHTPEYRQKLALAVAKALE